MKGTTIFANTLFTYTLAFTLRLKTTRRVLLCRVISSLYLYRSTRDVLWSVLAFSLPSESCPVDDSPSSAGPDIEWLTWTMLSWPLCFFYAPCLVDALFQARYCRFIVLFGSTGHEHSSALFFIYREPWHDRTETYSTSTKLFRYNSYLPMTLRKKKVENLHLSCSS